LKQGLGRLFGTFPIFGCLLNGVSGNSFLGLSNSLKVPILVGCVTPIGGNPSNFVFRGEHFGAPLPLRESFSTHLGEILERDVSSTLFRKRPSGKRRGVFPRGKMFPLIYPLEKIIEAEPVETLGSKNGGRRFNTRCPLLWNPVFSFLSFSPHVVFTSQRGGVLSKSRLSIPVKDA